MKVFVFASGSGGNCLLVSDKSTNILIDAGISMRRIENCLSQSKISMDDITGVLITHEHSDHISALRMIAKKYGTDIYAPSVVASNIMGVFPELGDRIREIPVGVPFSLKDISALAFHTSHDTDESVGYRLEGSGCFAIATDTGCITEEIETHVTGADAVLIESNHDENMLRNGPYPVYLKKRILSVRGHLSNDDCAEFARKLALSGTEKIILGHLSKINNTPEKALEASGKRLSDTEAELLCAPQFGRLEIDFGEETVCSP